MTKRIKQSIEYFRSNGSPFEWKLELLNSEYQTTPYSRSDRPNPDMVRYYVENRWSAYQFEEDALNLIFDSYVKTMLLWYKYTFVDFDFDADDLDNYDSFRTILSDFIRIFNLNCNLRIADKFLWTAGKEFFPRYVYKDLIAKYKPARHTSPG